MIIRIDRGSGSPVSDQIRRQVTRLIAVGTVRASEPLPRPRQLAGDLGVPSSQVARAYDELAADGLIAGHRDRARRWRWLPLPRRDGVRVAPETAWRIPADPDRELRQAARAYARAVMPLHTGADEALHAVVVALDEAGVVG